MKKLTFTLSILSSIFFTNSVAAQSCGTDGPSACTPSNNKIAPGFQDQNTIPCAERTVGYNETITFRMFDQFNFQGQQTVDSIKFNTIGNLPCGLCWSVNQTDKTYAGNEFGCIQISGTTNDVAGQYKLALNLTAWINGLSTGIPVSASLASQAGISLYLRVKDNGSSNCPNVDTAAAATNQTATTGCPVGINEVNNGLSAITIIPNPMSSDAKVTFLAEKSGLYFITITDLNGAVVSKSEMNVNQGANETLINRRNLNAGIYFLGLSDGKTTVTKRFTVID
ncbi:MAG: T9SS type A sorting domain-containing protein [Bacteroidetes bacterium]|nr:T9SS type A sorting domain-containing protein [Bacteroidota bacterium]